MAGTAEIHRATLVPSKLELLATWMPTQPWFAGGELEVSGQFRFVDPAGEVGVQVMLMTADGVLYQVPLSYRDAPLAGAQDALIGTMEHSVLGTRYVYDAASDPVFASELLRTIVEADTGAGVSQGAEPTPVKGSGAVGVALNSGTRTGDDVIDYGTVRIHVPRRPDEAEPTEALGTLVTPWTDEDGEPTGLVLAELFAS
jgi:hypothetical protein